MSMTNFLKGKVCALLEEGVPVRQISRRLSISRSTIRYWISNSFSLCRSTGSGRKRKTSQRLDRSILRSVKCDPSLSTSEVCAPLAEDSICASTVRRRLQAAGFKSRKRPSSIELTDSHKKARMDWAMRHCHWRSQWDRVVWTDEASVCLRGRDGRLRVWMKRGDQVPKHLTSSINQGGGRLLIWAAIWKNGRSELHIQKNNMNSDGYVTVLERHILPLSQNLGNPSTDWILMDDNATCHRSLSSNSFKSRAGIRTLQWPACSPDLNPIENVWSLLKRSVRKSLRPEDDLSRLEFLLRDAWGKLNQATINNLIDSLPSRIRQVIQRSEEVTRY